MECSATQWSAQGQPWKNTGLLQSSALSSRLCENTKQAHRGELFGFAAPRNLGQMSVERHEIAPASGPLAFSHTLVGEADHHTTILNGLVCLGALMSGNDRFLPG